jgi:hypothetical protein
MANVEAILAGAAELGTAHAHDPRRWLTPGETLAALGVADADDRRYAVLAAYEDARDIALAEADPSQEAWPQPISKSHKLWLRSNLVNHADLAAMLRVPPQRVYQEADRAGWPEPVTGRPRRHWYWWPHLKPALASRALRLAPGVTPPPVGPAPSWWGNMPADPDFGSYLRENLMDFARFAEEYDLSRAAILRASRYLDYPEPVIDRRANYWYWWPDLDRFLVRHRDSTDPSREPRWSPGRRRPHVENHRPPYPIPRSPAPAQASQAPVMRRSETQTGPGSGRAGPGR